MPIKYSAALGLALALSGPLAAGAQTTMPAIDCKTATAQMAATLHPSGTAMKMPAPPADPDRVFAKDMTVLTAHEMMLANIEMRCGTDAKAKEAAKRMAAQLQLDHLVFQNLF